MGRLILHWVCVCALVAVPLVGCSEETAATGGSGGSGGTGGAGGACTNAEDTAVYDMLEYTNDAGVMSMGPGAAIAITSDCLFGDPPGCGAELLDVVGDNNAENNAALTDCVVICASGQVDLTSDCLTCYADAVTCGAANCLVCAAGPAEPECVECLADNNCISDFNECTGIPPAATFDLSFSGTGYQALHDGQTMHFALWNDADDTTVVNTWEVIIDAEPLVASWPNAVTGGQSYTLYYYVDTNENDACDGPEVTMDHAWSMPIAEVTAAVEVTDTHNLDFTSGDCARHSGEPVTLFVTIRDSGEPLEGVEVCETDTDNCASTDASGRANIELPADQEVSYTFEKEGYVSGLWLDVTDDTFFSGGFPMGTDENLEAQYEALGIPYPPTNGSLFLLAAPRRAGATFDLIDEMAEGFYRDEEGTPAPDLTATTTWGTGGFFELPDGQYQVEFGGTAINCVAREAWPGDAANRIQAPVRTGFVTFAAMTCEEAP